MKSSRPCPVCQSGFDQADLFLEENIDQRRMSNYSFASRKLPEFMCHHLVRCRICDLVYADQPPSGEELAHAYHVADYDSSEEADDAAAAYVQAIQPLLDRLPQCIDALEIGAGTGVFLEHLQRHGFSGLVGVEPSASAINAAPASRQAWLRECIFREEDFAPQSFDLICCFMTMEHVPDPHVIASAAFRLLRPGGAFVTIVHDHRSLVNRILGKRSPIIDIEHMQLFSESSIRSLYTRNGFTGVDARAFTNRYSLRYWNRLLPLPAFAKNMTNKSLHVLGVASTRIGINVGNMMAVGYRPVA